LHTENALNGIPGEAVDELRIGETTRFRCHASFFTISTATKGKASPQRRSGVRAVDGSGRCLVLLGMVGRRHRRRTRPGSTHRGWHRAGRTSRPHRAGRGRAARGAAGAGQGRSSVGPCVAILPPPK
jgi:hypothetical protein